jgi:hypothetical protein
MGEDGTRPLRALRHGLRAGALGADGGLPSGACGGAKGEELEHCLVGAAHAALLGRGGDACASWLPVERPACLESLGFWGVASAPDLGAGVAAAASACAGAEERVEGGAASCARGAGLAAGWAADGAVGLIASECRSMGPQLGEGCLAGAASVVGRYQRARGGYACDELEGAAGAACRASAGAARSGR